MLKSSSFIVGLDIGYSNVKLTYGLSSEERPTIHVYPAYATSDKESDLNLVKKSEEEVKVYPNGNQWRVFTNRVGHRELHKEYHFTEMYLALFYGAIAKATYGRRKVIDHLVTGLPVRIASNFEEREKLAELLKGRHEISPGEVITIKEVTVLSQGVGVINEILNIDGKITDEELEFSNILVIDPGYFSTDYVTFARGDIKAEYSGSSLNATGVIIEEICRAYEADNPDDGIQETERVETAFRLGKPSFNNGFRNVEIQPLIDKVTPKIVGAVVAELLSRTRSIGPIHIIVSAGGGAKFYDSSIREAFPNAKVITSDEAVSSNSIGYWHYGIGAVEALESA